MMNRKRLESKVERPGGFTLIELLVVITIILIISVIALPTILPALSHRQVSEAARILQGVLVGARDSAIHNNAPSGIRLLPDPGFPLQYVTVNGVTSIDPTQPLAANRIIPIEPAPEYSEGAVSHVTGLPPNFLPYPCLIIAETVVYSSGNQPGNLPNAPTSWFWNIRVGDKIQINEAGPWYTVVGPMIVGPAQGNSELFVNVGQPGTQSPLVQTQGNPPINVKPEFLFLVNGQDDNGNGWIDEGFDGVDNDGDGLIDETTCALHPGIGEWEQEAFLGAIGVTQSFNNEPYTIQRRPAPGTNAREVSLPTNVVIDMTTWGYPFPTQANPNLTPSRERSRLPVNSFTGYVDILVYPNGTVVPTTVYSTPASFGLSGSFFHFWLVERSDVLPPSTTATAAPYLPIGIIQQQLVQPATPYPGPRLQGEYRLVTLFARTGQITTAEDVQFDNPANPANATAYNPNYPFLAAQQGIRGGR